MKGKQFIISLIVIRNYVDNYISREISKDAVIGEVTVLKEANGWYVSIVVKGSTAGLAGSDARGEGTDDRTASGQVYESSLIETGIP